MFIPPEKISRIFCELVEVTSCRSVSTRKLARVTGRIISNFFIMGDEGAGMRMLFWTLMRL